MKRWLIVLSFVWMSDAAAQTGSRDTLAQIGSTVITADELILRMETVPFPGLLTGPAEEIKKKALHALIAERLVGAEAARLGVRRDASARLMDRELENLFIRDALFKQEVAAKVRITGEEMSEGMNRLPFKFTVLSFLVRDKSQGKSLAAKLRAVKPEGVLSAIPSSLYTQADTITLGFGAPDSAYEHAVFSIRRGRVSAPFMSQNFGWAVVYVLERVTIPEVQKMNMAEQRRKVERVLRDKKEARLAANAYYGVLTSQHANANPRMFALLADSLSAFWAQDTARFKKKDGYILTSDMVEVLMHRLASYRDSTIVRFDEGSLTLGELLEMFRYEDYLSAAYEGEKFLHDLNVEIKSLAARELLAREGRARRLHELPAVKKDVSVWTTYLNAGALHQIVRESVRVSEDDIYDHLLRNKDAFGKQYEVNVREVLCHTEEEMTAVLEEFRNGASLEHLARTRSVRPVWSARGGESGFFPVIEHPEIGFRALLADSGQRVGPLSTEEGFSLLTLLGKRRTKEALTEFDSLKHNIALRLYAEKQKDAVDRAIVSLARRENVAVDYEKLKRVKVTLIPMFTRRNIGFGGRMTAAPLLMQQWDWVMKYAPAEQLP